MTKTTSALAEAFDSLGAAMASHPRDWAAESRDAWVYGIVCGWDGPAIRELQKKFGWSPETVARLRKYRKAVTDYRSHHSSGKGKTE